MTGNRAHVLPAPVARRRAALVVVLGVLAALVPFLDRPAAAAPAHRYVAVVIDGVGSSCVPWRSGLTAATLLDSAAKTVYKDDRILQIGARPSSPTKYPKGRWFLYSVASGAWSQSTTSAADTTLRAGSVNDWTYSISGKATAPKGDAAATYDRLCGALDKSSGTDGNGVTIGVVPGKPGKAYRSGAAATPSKAAKSSGSAKPSKKKSSPAKATSGTTAGSDGTTSDDQDSDEPTAPGSDAASDEASASGSAAPKGKHTTKQKSAAQASPVADTKDDDGGPGLGLATAGLLVFIVAGGIGLYVVRRRLLGDDAS